MISCSPKAFRGMEKQTPPTNFEIPSLFKWNKKSEVKFRCKVDAFQQKLSGVLILKKDTADQVRAVMITDFGLKVIDLSISNDGSYVVHDMMKHMDYTFVKESFALNLLMILQNSSSSRWDFYRQSQESFIFDRELKMLYFVREAQLIEVERYRGKSKLVTRAIIDENGQIELNQMNPDIHMTLKLIE